MDPNVNNNDNADAWDSDDDDNLVVLSLSTLFKAYHDDDMVIMKCTVQ